MDNFERFLRPNYSERLLLQHAPKPERDSDQHGDYYPVPHKEPSPDSLRPGSMETQLQNEQGNSVDDIPQHHVHHVHQHGDQVDHFPHHLKTAILPEHTGHVEKRPRVSVDVSEARVGEIDSDQQETDQADVTVTHHYHHQRRHHSVSDSDNTADMTHFDKPTAQGEDHHNVRQNLAESHQSNEMLGPASPSSANIDVPTMKQTQHNFLTSQIAADRRQLSLYTDVKTEEISQQQLSNICAPLQYQARFQCNKCPRKFSLKAHLINHQKTHEDPMSFYECDICRKMFQGRKSLNRHKLMHNENRKHECEFCHRKFYCIDHLKVHIRVHTGEKPHQCNVCGKRFSQSGTLSRHKMIHSGLRPHGCDLCHVGFKTKIELQKHMERLHLVPNTHQGDAAGHEGIHSGKDRELSDSDGTTGNESPSKFPSLPPHMYGGGAGSLPPISMISPFFPNPYLMSMFSHAASVKDIPMSLSSMSAMPGPYGPINLKVESGSETPVDHMGVSSSERRGSSTSESHESQENTNEVNLPATSNAGLRLSRSSHNTLSQSSQRIDDHLNLNSRATASLLSSGVIMSPPQHVGNSSQDVISTGGRSSVEILSDRSSMTHHYPADSSIDNALITAAKRIIDCPIEELLMYLLTSSRVHKCEYCQIIFADSAMYYIHRGMHTADDPFKCNICGKNAANKYDFMAHHHNY